MRLDKFLKVSRLVKRRTLAKEVSDQGRILINGRVAKPASEVEPGDVLELHWGAKRLLWKCWRYGLMCVPARPRICIG